MKQQYYYYMYYYHFIIVSFVYFGRVYVLWGNLLFLNSTVTVVCLMLIINLSNEPESITEFLT